MKITIVAVGLRQPAWADSAVEDYLGRFPKDWNVTIKAVKPELRAGQSTANIMKIEAERIRAAIPHNSLIIAMDDSNYSNLIHLAPSVETSRKIKKISSYFTSSTFDYVPDPYYMGHDGFELVLDLLEEACANLYRTIKDEMTVKA